MSPAPAKPEQFKRSNRISHFDIVIGAVVVIVYLWLTWDRIRMPFAADDMMNIGAYFRLGPSRTITSQVLLWRNQFRPMGAAFYLPLYYLFGLNPLPYQLAIVAIMSANAYLLFRFARSLGCETVRAGLAAIIGCYHPGLANLHYNIDMVYDILCFFFFFAAFTYYVRIRKGNHRPLAIQGLNFLLLYICALNSKEMAVTLPVILLAYEIVYYRQLTLKWDVIREWSTGPGWTLLVASAINLPYIWGRCVGQGALINHPAYTPVFSVQRVIEFQKGSLADLLCFPYAIGAFGVMSVWALVTYLAWRRAQPLQFCWLFMILTPLPIEFLVGRFQGELYIPMAGWAVFASTVFMNAVGVVSTVGSRLRLPGGTRVCAFLIASGVFLWFQEVRYRKETFINPAGWRQGQLTREVIRQLRLVDPHVRSHGKIVFLHDPFVDWDMAFIAELFFKDRHLEIHLQRLNPLPAPELANADSILDFREGKLVQVK